MEYIVEAIDKYVDDPRRQPDAREHHLNLKRILMIVCICMGKYLGNYSIIVYFTTKALFILKSVFQIFLLNLFLGQEFHLFGVQVLQRIIEGRGIFHQLNSINISFLFRLGYSIEIFS